MAGLVVLMRELSIQKNVSMGTSLEDEMMYFPVEGVTRGDLEEKKSIVATVNDQELALFARDGIFYAIQNKCPHQGGPLHLGDIEELSDRTLCVKCPWHSWRFSLHDGKCVQPYKPEKTALVFPVRVTGDIVAVGFTKISPKVFCTPPD